MFKNTEDYKKSLHSHAQDVICLVNLDDNDSNHSLSLKLTEEIRQRTIEILESLSVEDQIKCLTIFAKYPNAGLGLASSEIRPEDENILPWYTMLKSSIELEMLKIVENELNHRELGGFFPLAIYKYCTR